MYDRLNRIIRTSNSFDNNCFDYTYESAENLFLPQYGMKADTNPFRYCGEYFDEETGFVYLRARYYSPDIGRFVSEDPIKDGNNWYVYCGNNSIVFYDPYGYWPSFKDVTRDVARFVVSNPLAVNATQSGKFKDFFDIVGFKWDSKSKTYHAKTNAWQQIGGYNDFYDVIFDYATDMDNAKFDFEDSSGRKYILWAWKGDYLNLGAGAELGIYSNESGIAGKIDVKSPHNDIWLVDTNLAMKMTLTLKDKKGNTLIEYEPSEKQWWITGFDPYKQNVEAKDLIAEYSVLFTNESMYQSFYNKYGVGENKDSRWQFDSTTMTAIFSF